MTPGSVTVAALCYTMGRAQTANELARIGRVPSGVRAQTTKTEKEVKEEMAQKELNLPDITTTIARIAGDWWLGKSSPIGHQSWP